MSKVCVPLDYLCYNTVLGWGWVLMEACVGRLWRQLRNTAPIGNEDIRNALTKFVWTVSRIVKDSCLILALWSALELIEARTYIIILHWSIPLGRERRLTHVCKCCICSIRSHNYYLFMAEVRMCGYYLRLVTNLEQRLITLASSPGHSYNIIMHASCCTQDTGWVELQLAFESGYYFLQHCGGAAEIQEQRLTENGVWSILHSWL